MKPFSLYSNPKNIVKTFKGRKVVVVDDFIAATGDNIREHEKVFRPEYFVPGVDWNGIGTGPLREQFEAENHCHYEDETVIYMHESGFLKLIQILIEDGTFRQKEREKHAVYRHLQRPGLRSVATS